MSWRDNLHPASFRGVPFHYRDTSNDGGRAVVVHRFPLRNTASTEDLGLLNPEFKLEGYVDGDDYFAKRDALQAALDTKSPATLVHPYRGALTVQAGKYTIREITEAGGVAYFDMEFMLAGAQPSPLSTTDTAGTGVQTAATATKQVQTSFGGLFATLGHPPSVAAGAAAMVAKAQGAVSALLATPEAVLQDAQTAYLGLVTTVSNARQIATSFTGFYDAFVGDLQLSQFVFDNTVSSRGPDLPKDPSYGLAALCTWGDGVAPAAAGTTADLAQIGLNQDAVIMLIEAGATAALASLYAQTDFTSLQAAETARDQLAGFIDRAAGAASDIGDDTAYNCWQLLYAAAINDLTVRGKQLPEVVTYNFAQSLPALALAQRFYRDPSRAGELIVRNAAPHPLFMPLTVEALDA